MLNNPNIKIDFADSVSLSESGCLDELQFHHLFGGQGTNLESDGSISQRSAPIDQERISHALLSMSNKGLISSRSDVIALLSGELYERREEKSYLF